MTRRITLAEQYEQRRLDAAQWDAEHSHADPVTQEHLDRVQDDYERSIGWGVD